MSAIAIRAAGKSPATIAAHVVPVAHVVPAHVLNTPDALRAALAAVDKRAEVVGESTVIADRARGTLRIETLARFAFHAERLSEEYNGRSFLPKSLKGEAQGRVWRDATGESKPVKTATRTPGQNSMAIYLSEFAKVAMDINNGGIAKLESSESSAQADTDIKAATKEQKAKDERRASYALGKSFLQWRDALPSGDRVALLRVVEIFAVSTAVEFAPLYAAALSAPVDHAERA